MLTSAYKHISYININGKFAVSTFSALILVRPICLSARFMDTPACKITMMEIVVWKLVKSSVFVVLIMFINDNLLNTLSSAVVGSCGGYLYGPSGNFASPNYPNNYYNSASCTWYIRLDSGTKVTLYFNYFSTESGYDYVYVYDGSSTSSPLIGR